MKDVNIKRANQLIAVRRGLLKPDVADEVINAYEDFDIPPEMARAAVELIVNACEAELKTLGVELTE